jgi:hypothetical protein
VKGKLKRRYIVAILAFLGFCNIYMLRFNFEAFVSMVIKSNPALLQSRTELL